MIKLSHSSKLRALVITLIFGSVMILTQARKADAYDDRGFLFAFAVMAAATYATVVGVACAPIAAAKGEDYPGGFSSAYGDCFKLDLKSDQSSQAGENSDASHQPAEEVEDRNRFDD